MGTRNDFSERSSRPYRPSLTTSTHTSLVINSLSKKTLKISGTTQVPHFYKHTFPFYRVGAKPSNIFFGNGCEYGLYAQSVQLDSKDSEAVMKLFALRGATLFTGDPPPSVITRESGAIRTIRKKSRQ